MTNLLFYLVPVAAVVALLFAYLFFRQMMKESEGNATMKEIAKFVREGAMAYLKQQYKVVIIVFVILAALFTVLAFLGVQNRWVPFAFLTGGFFSGLAGFVGMKTATYASARTANAAQRSLNSGLKVAFRSGAVMGLTVVGLGLLDIAICGLSSTSSLISKELRNSSSSPLRCLHSVWVLLPRLFLHVWVAVSTQKRLMSVQTLSVK